MAFAISSPWMAAEGSGEFWFGNGAGGRPPLARDEGRPPSAAWKEAHALLIELVDEFEDRGLFARKGSAREIYAAMLKVIVLNDEISEKVLALESLPGDVLQARLWSDREQAAIFAILVQEKLPAEYTPEMEEAVCVELLEECPDLVRSPSDLERKVHSVQELIRNLDWSGLRDDRRRRPG